MQEERQPMGSESLGTLLRSWRDGTFSEIWDDWKWIWGYTKRYRRAVWFYTILGVASSTLGLVSADDPAANYVQIPMESTQWADGKFTQDDYKALVKAMFDGTLTVSNDITKAAKDFATVITVDDQGNIK